MIKKRLTKPLVSLSILCFMFICIRVEGQLATSSNGNYETIEGIKLYYEITGKGTPLVLLHTFFGSVEQWGDYTGELSKNYKVIAIDLPGHGRSAYMDTTDVYNNKSAARYIIELLKQLKIDSAYFLGASSGGTITLEIATMAPELVKKMVVVGAQIYYSQQTRKWVQERGELQPDTDEVSLHGIQKANLLEKQFYHYRNLYGELSLTPDILNLIKAKTLIVNGDNDQAVPFKENALQMYNSISNSHLWIVPNGGHLPHLDNMNHADFLRRVLEFYSLR